MNPFATASGMQPQTQTPNPFDLIHQLFQPQGVDANGNPVQHPFVGMMQQMMQSLMQQRMNGLNGGGGSIYGGMNGGSGMGGNR